ncbi:hypothetical protein KFE98_21440 [bacterium SCSIO 12741]|nr:hypothetical protein KFE98_21440 [bacterium SCSIO 12741]
MTNNRAYFWIRGIALFVCCVLLGFKGFSQEQPATDTTQVAEDVGFRFEIIVKHKGRVLPNARVRVLKDGSEFDQATADLKGDFKYLMPFDGIYTLQFVGEGLATKQILIDLADVPNEEKIHLYERAYAEISLFKGYDGLDVSILKDPVARIHFDSDLHDFVIDYEYSSKREVQLAKLEKQVQVFEKQEKGMEKEQGRMYDEYLAEADKYTKAGSYDEATSYYYKAMDLIPEREEAPQKLQEVLDLINRDEQYAVLVESGDSLFKRKEWSESLEKYQAAVALKSGSTKVNQQMQLIKQEMLKEEEQTVAFNNYMALADAAYSDGNFEQAKINYEKALDIRPGAALPQRKLETSTQKIEEKRQAEEFAAAQKAQQEADFENYLTRAQEMADAGDLNGSLALLAQAKEIHPDDPRLIEDEKFVQELLADKKAEEEAKLAVAEREKQKEADYEKYMELARASEGRGDLREAAFFYNKAATYKPEDQVAPQQAQRVNDQMAEQAHKEEEKLDDLDHMDKKSDAFIAALAKNYPQGVTERTYKKNNKTITKRIVVEGNKGTEYMKVVHSWGGVYYFKNGDPISQIIWDKETKAN